MKITDSLLTNYWMNGNFDLWQRATSITHNPAGISFCADRTYLTSINSGWVLNCNRVAAPGIATTGVQSNYASQVLVGTAKASLAAGDLQVFGQRIEGFLLNSLLSSRFATLSFWINTNVPGNWSVAIQNVGTSFSDRSFVVPFTVNASNVWQKIIIPVDFQGAISSGTWNFTNGIGLRVEIALGAGSSLVTSSTNQWVNGIFSAGPGNVNFLGSTSNQLQLSAFMLNPGLDASQFTLTGRVIGEEILLCQRFFEKTYQIEVPIGSNSGPGGYRGGAIAASSVTINGVFNFATRKRATPNLTVWGEDGSPGIFRLSGTPFTVNFGGRTGEIQASYGNVGGLSGLTGNFAYDIFGHYAADAEL